jgi:hypothetical protein
MVAPTKSLDDALDEIVAIAKIPEDCRSGFRNLVRAAIDGAVPHVKKLKPFSDESITSKSRAVTRKVGALLTDLKTMEKGSHAGNALGSAGLSLRAAAMDRGLKIKHFIDQLELLAEVAEAATSDIARSKRSAVGRPGGTPGNLGFDFFVRQLLVDARAMRVKLTIFKSKADGGFGGSLLKTVELLRAHLPSGFVPKAGLGRRLYRIVHDHPRNSLSR